MNSLGLMKPKTTGGRDKEPALVFSLDIYFFVSFCLAFYFLLLLFFLNQNGASMPYRS